MYYVYILANHNNLVLYTGVTRNLSKRLFEHKEKVVDGFTSKYNVHKLVYYETTEDVRSAIEREKQLKNWHRQWKRKLIMEMNPRWEDLSKDLD